MWLFFACTSTVDTGASVDSPAGDDTEVLDSGDSEDTAPEASACATEPTDTAALVPSSTPKNLIFLSIDTVRRDRVGRYSGGTQTPFLDELMAEGLVLDDHQSCSNWTYPSMICLLAGQDTLDFGFEPTVFYGAPELFPADGELLADWLQAAGFQTTMVSASPYLMNTYGTVNGFDTAIGQAEWTAETMVTNAIDAALDFDNDAPYYLHVHLLDPHAAFDPPELYIEGNTEFIGYDLSTSLDLNRLVAEWPELDAKRQADALAALYALYDGELRYTDAMIRRLITTLGGTGKLEDTLVVVASDHGEGFFDHQDSQGHGHTLYQEESQGLAFFWSADGVTPVAWGGPTTHADIVPTIYQALGLDPRESFTGHVVGTSHVDRVRGLVRYEGDVTIQAAQRGDWKLLTHWDGSSELYDLATDPTETADRTADMEDAETLGCLWERIDADAARLVEQFGEHAPADWENAP